MAGPTTDIEIQSAAAVLLGKAPFATIVDSNEFSVSLQKFYDILVPSELCQAHWKFAKKYIQLSKSTTVVPDFAQWNTAYALPSDLLMVVRVYPHVNYQIFEDYIYTSTSGTLKMEYNYDAPVSRWPAPFKTFIIYSLAANLALSVAEDRNVAQYLEGKRNEAKALAMWVDAQNSPNVSMKSQPWITTRRVASNNFRYFNDGF